MSERIEAEIKYRYDTSFDLIPFIEKTLGFCKKETCFETDEYFADLETTFIKDKICLRIRQKTANRLELTFKGKSLVPSDAFTKLETNLPLRQTQYGLIKNMLRGLGYYPYCTVRKKRVVYTKKINALSHQIMIDEIPSIGRFMELEILGKKTKSSTLLQQALREFKALFSNYPLVKTVVPYRDFVANELFQRLKVNQITNISFQNFDDVYTYFPAAVLNKMKQTGVSFENNPRLKSNETVYFEYNRSQITANQIPIERPAELLMILLAKKTHDG